MNDDEGRRLRQRELQLRIREVAYLLWEASGRDHGRTLDFWLAAEREVLSEASDAERGVTEPGVKTNEKPPHACSERSERASYKTAPGRDSEPEG